MTIVLCYCCYRQRLSDIQSRKLLHLLPTGCSMICFYPSTRTSKIELVSWADAKKKSKWNSRWRLFNDNLPLLRCIVFLSFSFQQCRWYWFLLSQRTNGKSKSFKTSLTICSELLSCSYNLISFNLRTKNVWGTAYSK